MAEKTKLNILQVLIDGGLDEDNAKKAKSIIDKDIIPKNYVPSDQYNDKVLELANATNDAKKANDDLIIANGYKQKWEDEVTAHATTKTDYATKATTAAKRTAARQALKALGAHDEDLDTFLLDKVDYDKMELDGDKVKDPKAFEGYKEQYKRYFGDTVTIGAGVATPPRGEGGNNYVAQLEAARKSGNTQESVRIKTEAAKEGVFLI